MPIPGYDTEDAHEATLKRTVASVSIVAESGEVSVAESDVTRPPDALSKPVELVGLETIVGLEALEITLDYDPAGLPPGASPTEVAVGVLNDGDAERLESTINLEETEVSAVQYDHLPGSTVVAIHTAESADGSQPEL